MKTINIYKYLLLVSLSAIISINFTSCKKDDPSDDTDDSHVHVTFNNKMGSMDLDYSHTHSIGDSNRAYSFNRVQYYISNIQLKKEDGSYYSFDNKYLLVSDVNASLDLEGAPDGHYHGIKFTVGIADTAVNHADPSTYDASNPLAHQVPSMHWSWAGGYKFLVLEGDIDASTPTDGTKEYNYVLHLGGDANTVEVELTKHFNTGPDEHPAIAIACDVEYLIENNIDLGGTDSTTHTMNNMPLAMKLKANIASSFSVQ